MKGSRAFVLIALALVAGFLAARWCTAAPSNQPSAEKPESHDFGALQQYDSLRAYLQKTGQTNTLQRFNDYMNASLASQCNAELGMNLIVLQMLRSGRSDDACKLLESHLDSDIVGLAGQLPAASAIGARAREPEGS